jgi:hypothetical protein
MLTQDVNQDVNKILDQMLIISDCKYCSDENCKLMGLDEDHWDPFKTLCDIEYDHDGTLTKEKFDASYNGMWYHLSDFAKEQMENTDDGSLYNLPWNIKNCIDWNKVWKTLSDDYSVYDNYVFRIL